MERKIQPIGRRRMAFYLGFPYRKRLANDYSFIGCCRLGGLHCQGVRKKGESEFMVGEEWCLTIWADYVNWTRRKCVGK